MKKEIEKSMRLSRLTTHIASLPLQHFTNKGHEKMEIKCVNCGRPVNLDHAVFENYVGTVKCFSCSSMMDVSIKEKVLHEASLSAGQKPSPAARQKYARSIL
jgi:hypothetical protein